MKRIVNRLRTSAYFRNVGILATGSILAQAVTIGASPILTRLYGPESFAAFALFFAIVSTLLPGVCGAYDQAIVVGKSDHESGNLLTIALWAALIICAAFLLVVCLFFDQFVILLNANTLGRWIYLAPIALFMSAAIAAFRYFANSRKLYGIISRIVLLQAVTATVITILIGLTDIKINGLLAGNLIGLLITCGWAVYRFRNTLRIKWRSELLAAACKYRDFPLFTAGSSMLNAFAVSLPVFFLTRYYPEAVTGYYALMTKVALAPLGFISDSVSQVHMKKVADIVNTGQKSGRYLMQVTCALAGIVLFPTLILVFFAPDLFAWVFGDRWRMAGELLRILMPALALRFVVSTVSPVFGATGHNRMGAFWNILRMACTFCMFLFFAPRLDTKGIFVAMLVTDTMLYLFYYLLIWHAFSNPRKYA